MNRALLLTVALAALSLAAPPDKARAFCSVLSKYPCTPYFSSVLRHHPYTPYSCGVTGGPCSPQTVLIISGVPILRVEGHAGQPELVDRSHPANRLNDIGPLLSKCLELPPDGEAQAGMELAMRFAFKRNGELMGDPAFTYTTHEAPENVRAAYHAAALDMMRRCTPLPVTDKLGGAIAGHPMVVTFRDTRGLKPDGPQDGGAPAPAGSKP
jgi:hypothetical protein